MDNLEKDKNTLDVVSMEEVHKILESENMEIKNVTGLIRVFEWISIIFLTAMVFIVFLNACLRYFFNTAITESEELARFMFIYITFMGSMIAFKENKLIAITTFVDRLGKTGKAIVGVIQDILILFVIGFILYSGILYTIQASTYKAQGFRINFGFVAVSLPIMAFGMFVIHCMNIHKKIASRKTSKER